MKHQPLAGKMIALLMSAALLAACSGSDTKEEDEAAAAAAAAAAEAAMSSGATTHSAELQRLESAAASAGNVFYFEFDSSTLTPEALNALNAHIAVLQSSEANVRLEGHTDERGTREYNMALGERRANAVRDYMVANGISGYRIESISYGEERPAAIGVGESNWAMNRRVELVR